MIWILIGAVTLPYVVMGAVLFAVTRGCQECATYSAMWGGDTKCPEHA